MNTNQMFALFNQAYEDVMGSVFDGLDYDQWVTDGTAAVDPKVLSEYGKLDLDERADIDKEAQTRTLKKIFRDSLGFDWGLQVSTYRPAYARLIVWLMKRGYLARPFKSIAVGKGLLYGIALFDRAMRPVATFMPVMPSEIAKDGALIRHPDAAYFDGKGWVWPKGEAPEDKEAAAALAKRRQYVAKERKARERIAKMDPKECLGKLFPGNAKAQQAFLSFFKKVPIYGILKHKKIDGTIPVRYFLALVCRGEVEGFASNTEEGMGARSIAHTVFKRVPYDVSLLWRDEYPGGIHPQRALEKTLIPGELESPEVREMWRNAFTPDLFARMPWVTLALLGRKAEAERLLRGDYERGKEQAENEAVAEGY